MHTKLPVGVSFPGLMIGSVNSVSAMLILTWRSSGVGCKGSRVHDYKDNWIVEVKLASQEACEQ